MYESITSIKDPRMIAARELSAAADRERAGKCLLEGEEILNWALAAGVSVEYVFFHAKLNQSPLLAKLSAANIPCFAVSEGILFSDIEREQFAADLYRLQANCMKIMTV